MDSRTWAAVSIILLLIGLVIGYYAGGAGAGGVKTVTRTVSGGAQTVTVTVTKTAGAPATTTTAASKKPIKIGVLMGLTGPWASIDGPAWNGIQLAIKQINDQGGLLGRKVEAIVIDTKGNEAETTAAAHRLVDVEHVVAVLGYTDTHWVLTAGPIIQKAGIPFITPGATYPLIPKRVGAFLACFGDNVQAAAMAEYAYNDLGLRNIAIWQDIKVDYSVAVTKYFKNAFEHLGGKIAYIDTFQTEDKDFSALIARLKSTKGVDGVYIGAIPDNAGLIVKQIRQAGVKIPILGEDGFDTPLLVQVAGKYAEGVLFTTHTSLESKDPKIVKFVNDYKAMFGHPPENAFAALGYDAMMVLAEAIKKAGTDNPAKITEALEHIHGFQGVTGEISYAPGQRVPQKGVAIIKIVNGKYKLVKMVVPKYIPPPEVGA